MQANGYYRCFLLYVSIGWLHPPVHEPGVNDIFGLLGSSRPAGTV
jgi:hypothetical protein